MKRTLCVLAIVASLAPFAASADETDTGGPASQARSAFQKIHDDARANAVRALSAGHQSQVQAIVDKVSGGQLEPRDATSQIDGILSDSEKTSVLAAEQQMRDQMRAAMEAAGGPGDMGGPGGPGGPAGGPGGPGAGPGGPGGAPGYGPGGPVQSGNSDAPRRTPDAGRALLMLELSPDAMRALREKWRANHDSSGARAPG